MDRNVAVLGHGVRGRWTETSSKGCQTFRTLCLSLLLCLVLRYLAQAGNLDVRVLFTSCTWECSPWR